MLSDRAQRYLATLQRADAVPLDEVRRLLGANAYPAWLDFHQRYAGYIEPIGADRAVWGLVHRAPQWLEAGSPEVDREPRQERWYVTCADVHPSYDYRLDHEGAFLGTPAETFDVHVERNALRAWFLALPGAAPHLHVNVTEPDLIARIQAETRPCPEASDRYFTHVASDAILAIHEPRTGRWLELLLRP